MATTAYKRTLLTGGTTEALDGIDGDTLQDGDFCFTLMSASGGILYIHELDEDSGLAESSPNIITPDSNPGDKRWILRKIPSTNYIPEGVIVAFSGGYFSNSSNGTFINAVGNTVNEVNYLLNGDGWYVCDGSELNSSTSSIYNGSGRYLPNLTDSRFIAGYSESGNTGGSNTISHQHTTSDHVLTTDEMPSHHHSISKKDGTQYFTDADGTQYGGAIYAWSSGTTGNTGSNNPHNHGDTSNVSIDNRPQYLTMIYIIKVD